MWLNATDVDCIKLNPEDCGWFMDGHLKPRWFVGDATPLQIEDIVQKKINDNKENEKIHSDDDGEDLDNYVASSDDSEEE